jgi:hypothetical protein
LYLDLSLVPAPLFSKYVPQYSHEQILPSQQHDQVLDLEAQPLPPLPHDLKPKKKINWLAIHFQQAAQQHQDGN